MEKYEDFEPNSAKMDRLSELPDRIIRHILCLVPTIYAVRMSLLSKRWRYMWYSLPVLEFSDHDFAGAILEHKLGRFMDKCLKLRENDMLNVTDNAITKFKLLTYYSWGRNDVGWFRLVAKSNIKELDLYIIRSGDGKLWHLPVDLLRVRSLTHLRLSGVQLKDLHSTSLPLLISLSLVRVHLDDQAIHNILLGCCSLEKLLLDSCHGSLNIEVSSISLKFLKIDCCTGLLKLAISSSSIEFLEMDSSTCATFQIKAVNLEYLRLSDIVLKDIHSVSLPSLVSLSLVRVRLDDQAIHNLLSGCCSLEKLFLDSCHGLYKPEVSSLSLKFLEIDSCQCPRFEIKAIKLESLLCHGVRACFKLNLSSCKTLKNLSLTSSISSEQGLEYAIPRLTCLESLTLHYYSKWKHVKIYSQHLKHFFWDTSSRDEVEVTLDTPNLVYFSFEGYPTAKISMHVPNLSEADVKFFTQDYNLSWYTNLLDFLMNFDRLMNLGLRVDSEEALIFPDKLRDICRAPLPTLKHLKVKTLCPLLRHNDLKDSLFWATPSLETLSTE